jgi:outer membrane protein OmpA-like peptidoglycan-associated protein
MKLRAALTLISVGIAVCTSWAAPPAGDEDCRKASVVCESAAGNADLGAKKTLLEQALQLCGQNVEVRLALADILAQLAMHDPIKNGNLLDVAVEHYVTAVKQEPKLIRAYVAMGECYRIMGLNEKAAQAYEQALALSPENPIALQGFKIVSQSREPDKSGIKRSSEIVAHFRKSSENREPLNLMGFQPAAQLKEKALVVEAGQKPADGSSPVVRAGGDKTVSGLSQEGPDNRSDTCQTAKVDTPPIFVVRDRQRFTNILFDEWSSELKRSETIEQLKELGEALASPDISGLHFVVEGHTDNRGDLERNMELSRARANAVRQYLANNFRVNPGKITVVGFGPNRPRVGNDSAQNRQKNRRVEVLIVDQPGN